MDPNLALLIACCRYGYEGGETDGLRKLLKGVNGAALAGLAKRHRVEGQVWRTLRSCNMLVPGTAPLALAAQKIAADGLRMAADSGRITAAFARASLPHLFLKGQALGKQAWGDALVKRQADIDLLVAPTAIAKAARLLGGLGFVQEEPEPSVDPVDWHRGHKESVWRSDDGIILDLHSRVADHPALLPQILATASPKMVEIVGGVAVPTLPDHLQLPYLAVHGASSAWFRLKWLAEFAALVHRLPAATLTELADKSARLGAGRTITVALVLSHRLFGTVLPEGLWFDNGAKRLVNLSIAALSDPREPTERRFGTLGIHRAQLLMAPGSHFFVRELLRQASAALIR